jgi:ferrous iron transport protein A
MTIDTVSCDEPLSALAAGMGGVLSSLQGGRTFRARVASLGFTPGAELTVVQNFSGCPLIVSVRGTRVALGRREAASMLIRRFPAAAGT